MELIKEILDESHDGLPMIPVKNEGYVKFDIESPEDFTKLMSIECILRKRVKAMDDARGTIRSKVHTLYVLDLKHSTTLKHSYIFFLRLFASDREGQLRFHKDQFSSLSSFFNEIARNDQPIPKIDCALTNLLAGPLSNKDKHCTVTWLTHITPLEKNFEETI
jgi:hypothetical protein